MDKIKILFLAANPDDTPPLALDREVEAISKELDKDGISGKFTLIKIMAAKADDISNYFLQEKPNIVHFSGHGSRASEIYLLDESEKNSLPVGAKILSMLFEALTDNIRCVVLNACFSEVQALVISKYVDCVVGMTRAIGDEAAIKFAQGFYRGLGNGRDVETAFKVGCFQIGTLFPDEHTTPQIKWKDNKPKKIVFGQPILKTKTSYDELDTKFSEIINLTNEYIDDPNSLNETKAWKSFKELLLLLEKVTSDFKIEDELIELKEIRRLIARLRSNRSRDKRAGLYESAAKTEDCILRNYEELNEKIKEIILKLYAQL